MKTRPTTFLPNAKKVASWELSPETIPEVHQQDAKNNPHSLFGIGARVFCDLSCHRKPTMAVVCLFCHQRPKGIFTCCRSNVGNAKDKGLFLCHLRSGNMFV